MDSDNQFVAEEVNGGIRTIAETVMALSLSISLLPSFVAVSNWTLPLVGATRIQPKDTGLAAGSRTRPSVSRLSRRLGRDRRGGPID